MDDNSNRSSGGQERFIQDGAYQNGAFEEYAMPRQYRGDHRNNLAMSVSLGPVDMLFGGNRNFDNDYHRRHQHDSWGNGNQRFDGAFVSRPYLTPDYSFRRGFENFGDGAYIQQRGWLPVPHRQRYMPEPQDWRMQQRRAETFWDSGTTNYEPPCPPRIEVEPRRREFVERPPELERREPTRTLPTNAMSEYDWAVYQKLCKTAESLIGKHTTAYDSRLPSDRLGCVKAASLLLDESYGLNTNEINTRQFEKELVEDNGFTSVAVADIKPGDVILAYRAGGDYSHAGVYMGNGKVFNNDSDLGTMTIQSVDKFNSTEFKRIVVLRRPAKVPSVAG